MNHAWHGWTALLLASCLACGGLASAQAAWTVQTVALRDLREANAEVTRLTDLGLAAYTEFTMLDGLQYVRVRVGCFDRETAERWAGLMRGGVTSEAVALPIDGPPPADVPCVAVDVGFRKPADWALVSRPDEQPTFRVEVMGHDAYLRYDGAGWRLWQAVAPVPEALAVVRGAASSSVGVHATSLGGEDIVRHGWWGALCPGRLLASIGDVAIVDQGDVIVACGPVTAP